MRRFPFAAPSAVALLLIALCPGLPAQAATDPLDALPAGTGVVVRLAAPPVLTAKVKAFAKNALPEFAGFVDQLGPAMGSLISNPTLAGIDAKRDWYVAVMPRAQQSPAIVFAAPASDAKKLRAAVGEGFTFTEYKDWVLYSQDAGTIETIGSTGAAKKSIRSSMDPRCGDVFAEGEIAFYVNAAVLLDVYKQEIEAGRAQFLQQMEQAQTAGTGVTQAQIDLNKKMAGLFFDTLGDAAGIAKRISISDADISTEAVVLVKPGSQSAKFLAKQPLSDFPLLTKLPTDLLVYGGISGDFKGLVAEAVKLSAGMYGGKQDEIEKLAQQFEQLTFKGQAAGFRLGDRETGVLRAVNLTQVEPVEKYMSLSRQMLKVTSHVETPGMQQDISYKEGAETIEGIRVDLVKSAITIDPKSDPTGYSQKFTEIMFGRNGMTQRLAVVDGLVVQAMGVPDTMKQAITAVRAGAPAETAATQQALAAVRGKLSPQANIFASVDLPRLLVGFAKIAGNSPELPVQINTKQIDSLAFKPNFAAMTVAAGKQEVRFRGVLPAEQVRGIFRVVTILQQSTPR